jgi:protein-S-isoprenylcysteine O-methyltransferase Ste14
MLIVMWIVVITGWTSVPVWLLYGRRDVWLIPLVSSPAMELIGAVLGAFALAVSLIAWHQMGDSWRLATNDDETTALVTSGVFGLVRHPIYAAQSVLFAASVLMLPSPTYLALFCVHVWCIHEKVRIEEKYLRETHGPAYRVHEQRVGRFWPRVGRKAGEPI